MSGGKKGLPEGWELVKLGDCCKLLNGRAYKKAELLHDGKYPVLRVGNFFSNRQWYYSDLDLDENKYCDDGDLLYAWSASFGPKIWDGGKVIYHYHIWKTVLDQTSVDKKYLYFWFDWDADKIKTEQGAGTTMIHVTKGSMEKRILPLPPLPEQRRIVAVLDECFAYIDKAIANTEQNLTNARHLFESHLNQIFTQKGEGWEEKILGDVCEVKDGTHDSPKYVDSGIPFVTQKNIRKDGLTFKNTKYISSSDHEKFSKRSNVMLGDIIISMIGAHRGMACIVDDNRIFSIKNVGLIKENEKFDQRFLLYFLKTTIAENYISSTSRGGAQPFVGLTKLRKFPVSVAPRDQQILVADKLDDISAKTQRLEAHYRRKLAALAELKQSLLQKAFAGELVTDTALKDSHQSEQQNRVTTSPALQDRENTI